MIHSNNIDNLCNNTIIFTTFDHQLPFLNDANPNNNFFKQTHISPFTLPPQTSSSFFHCSPTFSIDHNDHENEVARVLQNHQEFLSHNFHVQEQDFFTTLTDDTTSRNQNLPLEGFHGHQIDFSDLDTTVAIENDATNMDSGGKRCRGEEKISLNDIKRCSNTSKKDRHSKIVTAQGPRDRRMRLSLKVACPFFTLQDMLGFDKASKTVEWLMLNSKDAIEELSLSCRGDGGLKNVNSPISDSCGIISEVENCNMTITSNNQDGNQQGNNNNISSNTKNDKRVSRPCRRPVVHPQAKESRAKARARARERTIEKFRNGSVSSYTQRNQVKNNLNQLRSSYHPIGLKVTDDLNLTSYLEVVPNADKLNSHSLEERLVSTGNPSVSHTFHHKQERETSKGLNLNKDSYYNNNRNNIFLENWDVEGTSVNSRICATQTSVHPPRGNILHSVTNPFHLTMLDARLPSIFEDFPYLDKIS